MLITAIALQRYERKRVFVVGKEAEHFLNQVLDFRCAPKIGLSYRNDECKIASPRFRAVIICPICPSPSSAVGTENVGCDFEKINQPSRKVVAENLSYVLEANVYVGFAPNRVEFEEVPPLCNGIAGCDGCPAAHEKARGDQGSLPCSSNSLRSLLTATARNLDVFPRSIPSW